MPGVKKRRVRKRPKKDGEFVHNNELERNLPTQARRYVPKPGDAAKKTKLGMLERLDRSKGLAILETMLNMEALEAMLPYDYRRVMERPESGTEEDVENMRREKARMHDRVAAMLLDNYKWAMNLIAKIVPKDVGIFGQLNHAHTLSGLTRRAMTEPKDPKVIEMARKRREGELFGAAVDSSEREVEQEIEEFYNED